MPASNPTLHTFDPQPPKLTTDTLTFKGMNLFHTHHCLKQLHLHTTSLHSSSRWLQTWVPWPGEHPLPSRFNIQPDQEF